MNIKDGTVYQIMDNSLGNFNSAKTLKITSHHRSIVSFNLGNQQGYGSMPVQHLRYLLKRNYLTELIDERKTIN
ncbi:hypothetical protein [Pseudalkalibacillus salsuginis]|uniref:hypothetical protein n=1 Tax=Pseudalkalibacillus salsuginis TaxID=2910972 RepID=UPI001CD544DB|nr:hypothetical protein [Pseudalkalibacillus salsuginis]MCF6411728.1 hypothetical protein [Pseudalkalibacillus salsuginis]